jgi:hypothetical protein
MNKSALEHSCEKHGCARRYLDPKLHEFDDCFAGAIRMGDVDACVERNGHVLWMEWKRGAILDAFDKQYSAQLRMAKAFTNNAPGKQTYVFVIGDPVRMTVERFRIVESGQWKYDWIEGGTERFKDFLKWWFQKADQTVWRVAQ